MFRQRKKTQGDRSEDDVFVRKCYGGLTQKIWEVASGNEGCWVKGEADYGGHWKLVKGAYICEKTGTVMGF